MANTTVKHTNRSMFMYLGFGCLCSKVVLCSKFDGRKVENKDIYKGRRGVEGKKKVF